MICAKPTKIFNDQFKPVGMTTNFGKQKRKNKNKVSKINTNWKSLLPNFNAFCVVFYNLTPIKMQIHSLPKRKNKISMKKMINKFPAAT